MKPYPKYKDSWVEWIGEVPEGWSVLRLKWVCNFLYGESLSAQEREDGTIPVYGSNGIVSYHNKSITEKPCIIVGRKGSFGKVTFSEKKCYPIDTTYYIDCTSTKKYMRWLWYLLPLLKMDEFSRDSAVPGLNREDAYRNIVALPSPYEQKQIAAYLNRKTTQIDNLISKKQKLIELLKEERAAIINQAVTKGLNADAPMKDSGIEWLGEVPAHWEVKRLKYIASINEENLSEKTDANIEIKYIDIGNVCLGSIVNEPVTMYFKDAPSRAKRIVRKGDTIISTVRTYLKAIIYIFDVPQNLIVSTGFAVIRPKDDFDKKFISFLLTSEKFVDTICSLSVGVSYPAINASDIANIMIWFPPDKTEQAAIVEHVNKTTTKIDQATSKIEKQIALLKEYHATLISEVVTGKIDVRT